MLSSPETDTILQLDSVRKTFGSEVAVADVSLDIRRGEFVTLLGPSGCGKSTILRMIAGFERPTRGRILMDGRPLDGIMPYDRNVGLVFQNLALFPHMSVRQNVEFGLSARRISRADRAGKAERMLALVGLEGFAERRVTELSGGQRQRVALARSLVIEPLMLLLDEPLSALDLKLRRQLQEELKRIQQTTRTTFLFVTHDQEEALSMSDRIAVMNKGRVEQFSSSIETYYRPRTPFVARFVGDTNLLSGKVLSSSDGHATIEIPALGQSLDVPSGGEVLSLGQPVAINLRPERIVVGVDAAPAPVRLEGTVLSTSFSGPNVSYALDVNGHAFLVSTRFPSDHADFAAVGSRLPIGWWPESATLLPTNASAEV